MCRGLVRVREAGRYSELWMQDQLPQWDCSVLY